MVNIGHSAEETAEREVAEAAYGVGLAEQVGALLRRGICAEVYLGYGRVAAANGREHCLGQRFVGTSRIEGHRLQKVLSHSPLLEILLRPPHSSGVRHVRGVVPRE